MPCTALAVLSGSNMHRARLVSLISSELLTRSTTCGQMLNYPSWCTSLHREAILFAHLQPACTSAESRTFRVIYSIIFHVCPIHLWLMGVTRDRLIRSLHVSAKCAHSFSDIPNVRRQEWTLQGKIRRSLVEQIVFSSLAPVPKINRPEYWHSIPSADTAHSGTLMGEIVTRLGGHTTLTTGRKLKKKAVAK